MHHKFSVAKNYWVCIGMYIYIYICLYIKSLTSPQHGLLAQQPLPGFEYKLYMIHMHEDDQNVFFGYNIPRMSQS